MNIDSTLPLNLCLAEKGVRVLSVQAFVYIPVWLCVY